MNRSTPLWRLSVHLTPDPHAADRARIAAANARIRFMAGVGEDEEGDAREPSKALPGWMNPDRRKED